MTLYDIAMWYYIEMSEYDIKLEDVTVLCQDIWIWYQDMTL